MRVISHDKETEELPQHTQGVASRLAGNGCLFRKPPSQGARSQPCSCLLPPRPSSPPWAVLASTVAGPLLSSELWLSLVPCQPNTLETYKHS